MLETHQLRGVKVSNKVKRCHLAEYLSWEVPILRMLLYHSIFSHTLVSTYIINDYTMLAGSMEFSSDLFSNCW